MKTNSHRNRWLPIVFVIGCLLCVIAGTVYFFDSTRNPLLGLETSSLQSVEITTPNERFGVMEVPRSQWGYVVRILKSNLVGWFPKQWPTLCTVEIHLESGQRHVITVYETGQKRGAYRINGIYYEGGDERHFVRLIDDHVRRSGLGNLSGRESPSPSNPGFPVNQLP